jgi:hypothetical protein
VDHDDRDVLATAPEGAVYVLPVAKIATKSWWATVQRAVRDDLVANRHMTLFANRELKLWSRPAETREAFETRCRIVADEREDAEAAKVRDRIQTAEERARDKVAQLQADVSARRSNEVINIGSSILGGFLGGRSRSRGVAADLRRAASNRGQTKRTKERLDIAESQVADAGEDMAVLEEELAAELLDIDHRWMQTASAVTEVEVGLEKNDVVVTGVTLVWVPTAR